MGRKRTRFFYKSEGDFSDLGDLQGSTEGVVMRHSPIELVPTKKLRPCSDNPRATTSVLDALVLRYMEQPMRQNPKAVGQMLELRSEREALQKKVKSMMEEESRLATELVLQRGRTPISYMGEIWDPTCAGKRVFYRPRKVHFAKSRHRDNEGE